MVSVVFLPDGQFLPVLAAPGETSQVVAQLDANQTRLPISGRSQRVGEQLWVELRLPDGTTGWAQAEYLTPAYAADQFCASPQVQGLSLEVVERFHQKDGDGLAKLVSPIHGLRVRTHWSSSEVFLGYPPELHELFIGTKVYKFGDGGALQTALEGTFLEVLYPLLVDMRQGAVEICNTLAQGLAADWVRGYIQWPFEYANLNYLVLYRPAPPENELDWRMWAFGFEWFDQRPFLTVMVHYRWDF